MKFDELNDDTYILFAIKHYENPHCVTREDFDEDLKRFKYLKRLLKRYVRRGPLRIHLVINHIIILYNVFGEAATPLLFFKLEREYWSLIKTLLIYLNKYPVGMLPDLETDPDLEDELNELWTTVDFGDDDDNDDCDSGFVNGIGGPDIDSHNYGAD